MKARTVLLASTLSSGALLLAAPVASSAAAPNATAAAGTATRLQAVAFTSPQQGYGLFSVNTGSARKCRADVARTTDGGSRFTRPVPAVSWPCSGDVPVSSIAADASGDVFAYGPALRISHDHGRSWTSSGVKGAVLDVAVAGRSVQAVTTHCTRAGSAPDKCQILLLDSANGGRTWRYASDQPAGAVIPGSGASPTGGATLTRTSSRTAYLLATPVLSAHGLPELWITKNGGSAWHAHRVPCGLGTAAALAVARSGALFVACAGQPGAGFQLKSVVTSADGGRTWHTMSKCGTPSCGPLGEGYLEGIAAVPGRTLFLVGDRSPLLVSHDAGAAWHVRRPMIGDGGGGTYQIAFFGSHGIILGSDQSGNELPAIWHTSDNGATWHLTRPVVA
ncbi:MAG TPA: hypothetical protein VMA95_06220 [Streptosporangiaceae bacterium]|nr:hypothetical protein [Streptosporangiaceae bacterium]